MTQTKIRKDLDNRRSITYKQFKLRHLYQLGLTMLYQCITSEKVILWTSQPLSIWEELLQKSEVAAFESDLANSDPKHLYGYDW